MIKAQNPQHAKALKMFKDDILFFGKTCLPSMFTEKSPAFHREIADLLMDSTKTRLNLIAPRGHAKSSLVGCLWVIYHLFFEPGPHVVVLVSKTEGHAVRLLQTIKDALNYSMPLRKYIGYYGEFSAKTWKSTEVILANNDMIICRGTGQQVVGLKHINQRPTLIILDDPEDMTNTKTAEAMEFNLRWLLQSLMPSRDAGRGRVCIIGTPQHQRCMVETIATAGGWTTRRWDSIVNEEAQEVLWPELWPWDKLMEEKETVASIGRVASFYREFRCQVIGDEAQLFKPEHIRYYEGTMGFDKNNGHTLRLTSLDKTPIPQSEQVDIPVHVYMGVDPASSVNQSADYSAIVVVAIDSKKNRYVIAYFRKRVTPLALSAEIIRHYKVFRPGKVRIEVTGYQEMLREHIRDQMFIPGLEIRELPRNKKSNRLEGMQNFIARKMFFIKTDMVEMFDELIMYPRGKHDDLLDGLYYATKKNYPPYVGKVVEAEKQVPEDAFLIEDDEFEGWLVSG